jgi:hypothetical protein
VIDDERIRLGDAPTLVGATASWSAKDDLGGRVTVEVPIVDASAYRVVREVARGGVGCILEAVDTRLGREVALKKLLRPGVEVPRFVREAMLTARLQHPGIVPIHEVGQLTSGEPFIAMKLVRGRSLREEVRARTTIAARIELVSAVLAVADAVAYAHSQRVIHRDLKPSNVLLGSFGETVVVDWGLAKHLDAVEQAPAGKLPDGGADATALGAVIGTPAYMPPEQALGNPVDERADVYALGAMLYEVLSGAPPIEGDSAREVIDKLLHARPVPLAARTSGIPRELAAIVEKAMMADPAARYRDAYELAVDLRRFQVGQMVSARRNGAESDPALERAFREELRGATVRALQVACAIALTLVPAFALMARVQLGRFDLRDLMARAVCEAVTLTGLLISRTRLGHHHSQGLGVVVGLNVCALPIAVDALLPGAMHNAVVGSLLLTSLGVAVLVPFRPFCVLAMFVPVLVAAAAFGAPAGDLPVTLPLLASSAIVAYVASRNNLRVRRAEFYNRQRLQTANERLARVGG